MDSSNPKPPSKNDIELKEKRVDAEVNAHQRTDNLAVLIPILLASQTKG